MTPTRPGVALVELLADLNACGLSRHTEVKNAIDVFVAKGFSGPPAEAAEALLRRLAECRLVTKHQATQLGRGNGRSLVLDQYTIIDQIGSGGMGVTHLALDTALDRLAVIKRINDALTDDPTRRERFRREAQAAAQLDSPHVARIYALSVTGPRPYSATEYVDGLDLARLVNYAGPLPVGVACEYVRQAAVGLRHLHERGLVHRDVKPHNLMVSLDLPAARELPVQYEAARSRSRRPANTVKLIDLGLVRPIRKGESVGLTVTSQGVRLGTPCYMPPEQWLNPSNVDDRSDVYSLGCVLYVLLAGRLAFDGAGPSEVALAHFEQTFEPIGRVRPEVPAAVGTVLARMVEKVRANRPSAGEVAAALEPFADAAGFQPRPASRPGGHAGAESDGLTPMYPESDTPSSDS